MRGTLVVEDASGPRFELALDLLERGESFVFIDCGILKAEGELRVLVPSPWEPEAVTESRALEELQRARRNVARLVESSDRFRTIASDLKHVFILVYDYGMGGLWLCRLSEPEGLEWYPGYPAPGPAA